MVMLTTTMPRVFSHFTDSWAFTASTSSITWLGMSDTLTRRLLTLPRAGCMAVISSDFIWFWISLRLYTSGTFPHTF